MFVPFDIISPASRIWVYQSNRKFTAAENAIIADELKLFTEQWAAHGQPLKTSFEVFYDQFIVVAADESYHAASGCSIDESVHTIRSVEKRLDIQLLDRNQVAFLSSDGVLLVPVGELKQAYEARTWHASTLVFNNLITSKGQLTDQWIVPAGTTWLKRYLKASAVTQ
jgi:hypothetical protein